MNATRISRSGAGGERGFAILLVLWLLVLLSAIAIHVAATGRTEARIAANIVAAAQAEALADAGVAEAVFALGDPDRGRRWRADGERHELILGEGRVVVAVGDENARINPNLASDKLLAALFRRLGADDDRAAALAAAIGARVRPNPFLPPAGTGMLSAAGAPAPAPFDSIDDLAELPGMTAALLAAARPYLSVYAATTQPAGAAAPLVAAAIADVQAATGAADTGTSSPGRLTVAIAAAAENRRGGRFVREAVVRLDPAAPEGYVVLRWTRGPEIDDAAPTIATVP